MRGAPETARRQAPGAAVQASRPRAGDRPRSRIRRGGQSPRDPAVRPADQSRDARIPPFTPSRGRATAHMSPWITSPAWAARVRWYHSAWLTPGAPASLTASTCPRSPPYPASTPAGLPPALPLILVLSCHPAAAKPRAPAGATPAANRPFSSPVDSSPRYSGRPPATTGQPAGTARAERSGYVPGAWVVAPGYAPEQRTERIRQ